MERCRSPNSRKGAELVNPSQEDVSFESRQLKQLAVCLSRPGCKQNKPHSGRRKRISALGEHVRNRRAVPAIRIPVDEERFRAYEFIEFELGAIQVDRLEWRKGGANLVEFREGFECDAASQVVRRSDTFEEPYCADLLSEGDNLGGHHASVDPEEFSQLGDDLINGCASIQRRPDCRAGRVENRRSRPAVEENRFATH